MTDNSSSGPTEPRETSDEHTTAAEDELVSAVLDGEATPQERALVDGDPRLRARLDSFNHVRDSLGSGPPVLDATREASIAAALDAAAAAEADPAPIDPGVAFLAVERARRRRRVATIAAAAAALLIVVPLLAIALTGRGTEHNDFASTAANDSSDASESDALASGGAADASPSSTTGQLVSPEEAAQLGVDPSFVGDFGPLATASQLRTDVQGALADAGRSLAYRNVAPESTTTAPSTPPNFDARISSLQSCGAAVAAADPTLGYLVLTATATWSGEPALVLVFRAARPAEAGEQTGVLADVIVLARPDCSTIGRFVA